MKINTEEKESLKAFIRGEMTWAEVEGFTADDAQKVAELGVDLAATGNLQQARVLFEGLVAVNPNDAAARAALGTILQKQNLIAEALEQYTAAIELDPVNPVALANRGELLVKRGDATGYADLANAVKADREGRTAGGKRAAAIVKAIALKAVESGRAV